MYGENRNRFGHRPTSFAPVKVGEEYDVTVESVGEKGDGIAKVKGFVIFVPNTKEGDNVKIKVTRVLRKVGFGEVVGESSSSSMGDEEVFAQDSTEGSESENIEVDESVEEESEDESEDDSDEEE